MRRNPLLTLAGLACTIIALIMIANAQVDTFMKEKPPEVKPQRITPLSPQVSTSTTSTETSEEISVSQDVEQYGIYIRGEEKASWSDSGWEAYVTKTLDQAQVLDGEANQVLFENMQKTPQDFKKKLAHINMRIQHYENLKMKDPHDLDVQQKLENLYVLKSTLLVLENKITASPSPSQDE